MLRKLLIVFVAFSLLLFACVPTTQQPASTTTTQPDPYDALPGEWASPEKQLYQMHGATITFSDDLTDTDRVMWLSYFDETVELLPPHLKEHIKGLLFSFNSGNTCVEDNYLACFTSYNYSVFMSTTKQMKKRDNLKTMLHEIGHAVDYKIDGREPMLPEDLHKNSDRPTNYAGSSAYEDFADSFAVYILSPGYLKVCCEARYEFMKDKVFFKKEYFSK